MVDVQKAKGTDKLSNNQKAAISGVSKKTYNDRENKKNKITAYSMGVTGDQIAEIINKKKGISDKDIEDKSINNQVEQRAKKTISEIQQGNIKSKNGFFVVGREVAAGEKTAELVQAARLQEKQQRHKNKIQQQRQQEKETLRYQSIYHKKTINKQENNAVILTPPGLYETNERLQKVGINSNIPIIITKKNIYKSQFLGAGVPVNVTETENKENVSYYNGYVKTRSKKTKLQSAVFVADKLIFKSDFSDRGYDFLDREKKHQKRMERVQNAGNKISTGINNFINYGVSTFYTPKSKTKNYINLINNEQKKYNLKSFPGKVTEILASNSLGIVPNLIYATDKINIVGQGVLFNNKKTITEIKDVYKDKERFKAVQNVFNPTTPEGFVSYLAAGVGAAQFTYLRADTIKLKYQGKLTGKYQKYQYKQQYNTQDKYISYKLEKVSKNKFGTQTNQYSTIKTKKIAKGFDVVDLKKGTDKYFNPYYQTTKYRQTTLTNKNIDLIGQYRTGYTPKWHFNKMKQLGQKDLGSYKINNPVPVTAKTTLKSYGTLEQGKTNYFSYYQRKLNEYSFISSNKKLNMISTKNVLKLESSTSSNVFKNKGLFSKMFRSKRGSLGGQKTILKGGSNNYIKYRSTYYYEPSPGSAELLSGLNTVVTTIQPTFKPVNLFGVGIYNPSNDNNFKNDDRNIKKRKTIINPLIDLKPDIYFKPTNKFNSNIKIIPSQKITTKLNQKPKQKQKFTPIINILEIPDKYNFTPYENDEIYEPDPPEPKKPINIPLFDLNLFDDSGPTKRKKGLKRKYSYAPDIRSIMFGITSNKKQKSTFTGFEERPLLSKFKGVSIL